jgi:hypothetical protein
VKPDRTIHLGFEVGVGREVAIPVAHMCVTGQTQQAGKTTALEALITRSGLRAVTFITKRGEESFAGGRRMPPFFRERADWVFVSSLIDATLGEKNKLLRAWLMKVCRNTTTLAQVQRNVIDAKASARGFSESIYTEIEGYLELVVPQLAQLPPARQVVIGQGLNVMDLSPYSSELQGLVMRSVLEHVYEHEDGVITVIPEAWEFLPEGRGSPVKREAENLIRKGGSLKNFVWIDSQDLAGVWKLVVRACPVVLLGVQREANEIKRTLANIPASVAKPNAASLATLELGQFFACFGKHTIRTYVQPSWLIDDLARMVALGELDAGSMRAACAPEQEDVVTKDEAARLTRENEQLKAELAKLRKDHDDHDAAAAPHSHRSRAQPDQRAAGRHEDASRGATAAPPIDAPRHGASHHEFEPLIFPNGNTLNVEYLYKEFKARLIAEAPALSTDDPSRSTVRSRSLEAARRT